ncbi:hypothetical protein FLL45_06510 [Aliikangiella marina]|uniref:Serine aminopeptidase S33 domain-containing protein n=1 Tax=Aliikangiella marina TaxID=1712262 RepID=A0A545TBL2_9GAMM|nr:hypothetical protein [Aliikangiella marina]TQV74612.1 hypothetical protein FLL45_06510 [Aliikangiella marina]
MINAFFFGEKSAPLFGIHQLANQAFDRGESLVICPPIGHEFARTHKTLKLLSDYLANDGFSVLRFSYYATGDSSGESHKGSVIRWIKDIQSAVEECKEQSGCQKVSLLGLRLGSLLALEATRSLTVSKLIMWEPIISGATFLEQIKEMHQFAISDPERFYLTEESVSETQNEYLGHYYSPELQSQLQALSFRSVDRYSVKNRFAVTSEPQNLELIEQLNRLISSPLVISQQLTNWRDSRQLGRMFTATQSFSLIRQCLRGE